MNKEIAKIMELAHNAIDAYRALENTAIELIRDEQYSEEKIDAINQYLIDIGYGKDVEVQVVLFDHDYRFRHAYIDLLLAIKEYDGDHDVNVNSNGVFVDGTPITQWLALTEYSRHG
jgi:hypothetical protein